MRAHRAKGVHGMCINDQRGNDIITERKSGIDRWNANAAERSVKSVFRLHLKNTDDDAISIIATEHATDYHEWKALAREIKTGEVRSTKPIIKRGRFVGVKTRQSDPKAWKSLADKSAREIV